MTNIAKIRLLICCIVGELLLQTANRGSLGIFLSPLLHFIFALGSGVLLLSISSNKIIPNQSQILPDLKKTESSLTKNGRIRLGMVTATMIVIACFLQHLFVKHPINMLNPAQTGSDVVPQIMFFVTRAIAGIYPYQPMTAPLWGYTLTPTYMPFQWIPYIPAQFMHFDYRWIPFIALFLALMGFLFRSEKSNLPEPSKWMIAGATVVFLIFHYKFNFEDCINTVEPLVASYYILFALALLSRKPWLIALAIVLCLLSRYSIVLWLPLFFLIYFVENGFKKTLQLGLLVLAGISLCYGPFLLKNPHIFSKGYEYYTAATAGEWTIQNWQPPGSYPPHLERGLGLAVYFYKFCGTNIEAGIQCLRIAHLTLCLSVITILSIYYWRNRRNIYPAIFAVASFKIYLTFFYGFIQIPYSYLYILPLLLDLVILYLALIIYSKKNLYSKPSNFLINK